MKKAVKNSRSGFKKSGVTRAQAQTKGRKSKFLEGSPGLYLALFALLLALLQTVHELTVPEDQVLGLLVWLYLSPLYIIMAIVASVWFFIKRSGGQTKIFNTVTVSVVTLLIAFVLNPALGSHMHWKRAHERREKSAITSEEALAENESRMLDEQDISRKNTGLLAYSPDYTPDGFEPDHPLYKRNWGSISQLFRYGSDESYFSFITTKDRASATKYGGVLKENEQSGHLEIGKTSWGASIFITYYSERKFTYLTTKDDYYLLLLFGNYKNIFDEEIVTPEVTKIFDSVRVIN